MDFDFRSAYPGRAEGQQAEGGTNHNQNCVAAFFCAALAAVGGYREIEPQEITDGAYGPNYVGPLSFDAVTAWVVANIDRNLIVTVLSAPIATLVATMETAASKRYPIGFLGHCDEAGNYVPRYTGFEHCSAVVARFGPATWVRNSEYMNDVTMLDVTLARVYGGCIVVIHKPIPGPPPTKGETMNLALPCQTALPLGLRAASAWLAPASWTQRGGPTEGTVHVSRYDDQTGHQWEPLADAKGNHGQLVELISFGYDADGGYFASGFNAAGELWQFHARAWTKQA